MNVLVKLIMTFFLTIYEFLILAVIIAGLVNMGIINVVSALFFIPLPVAAIIGLMIFLLNNWVIKDE